MMLLALAACLDHDPIPGQEEAFVAMQADFQGYRSWEATEVAPEDTGHPDGARTVYVNAAPPAGVTAFPVGTVIVKEIAGADIHAMVKRGGGFNPEGAIGWEWFELVLSDDGTPVIKWRGVAAPEGEAYGALPGSDPEDTGDLVTGDCNVCHGGAVANDFVHAIPLEP